MKTLVEIAQTSRSNISTNVSAFIERCNTEIGLLLQKKIYGQLYIQDDIVSKIDGQHYIGIKYNVGNRQAIRYITDGKSILFVELWTRIAEEPDFEIKVEKRYSVSDLINALSTVFSDDDEKLSLKEAVMIMSESETMLSLTKMAQHTNIVSWIKEVRHREDFQKTLGTHKIKPLFLMYQQWGLKKKINTYSYPAFLQHIKPALDFKPTRGRSSINVKPAKTFAFAHSVEVEKQASTQKNDAQQEAILLQAMKLNANEVFEQMEVYIESVAKGNDYSLIIAGDTGVGKTFSVTKKLKELGLSQIQTDISSDAIIDNSDVVHTSGNQYLFFSGKISIYGLYTLLFDHNNELLVFDDCDSFFDSADGVNMIKNVTDDKKNRTIGMRNKQTMRDDSPYPSQFTFTGRIIFITNKYLEEIDSAIRSRALIIALDFTQEEILERIKKIMNLLLPDLPQATAEVKQEVLAFLLDIKALYRKLDIRTYEQAVKERLRGSANWKKIVANTIILKAKR